jgi:RNA polymerase sigma-70 factor, ECF subfamily
MKSLSLTASSALETRDGIGCAEVDAAAEAELVRASVDGDAQAARDLIRLHHRRIYGFICRLTRQPQDAEDLTQETFIKAFGSLHRFDTSRPLVNWLFTIARRTTFNHFRSTRRWVDLPETTPSPTPSPDRQAEENDQVEDLWERARRVLSDREYEVLWLRFGENLSTAETARVAGLTATHVKVLVFRARRRLLATTAPS